MSGGFHNPMQIMANPHDQYLHNMQQQISNLIDLVLQIQRHVEEKDSESHQKLNDILNTMQESTKVADTTKNEVWKNKDQIVSVQEHLQYISSQVHRLHEISKMEVLDKFRAYQKPTTASSFSSMTDKYRVASSYLNMQMDSKLFVFLPQSRRTILSELKKKVRDARDEIQKLSPLTDQKLSPLTENRVPADHTKALEEWHTAIYNAEIYEKSNYKFATRRRAQMKGAEPLSTELANFLDFATKSNYNKQRNEIQHKEGELQEGDKTTIKELATQLTKWRTNLELLFLTTKYARHISKTNNIQKAVHGKVEGITVEDKKKYHDAQSKFIMGDVDEHLLPLKTEDKGMGLTWAKTPDAGTENLHNYNEKEISKIRQSLQDQFMRQGVGAEEIILTRDKWAECAPKLFYHDTTIMVGGDAYTPKNTATVSQIVQGNDANFQQSTKDLLEYIMTIDFDSLITTSPEFKPGSALS